MSSDIATDLSALAARLARGSHADPIAVVSALSPQVAADLASLMATARHALIEVRPNIGKAAPDLPNATAILCACIAVSLRHLGALIPAANYARRLQLSNAASVFHVAFQQLVSPLHRTHGYLDISRFYAKRAASGALIRSALDENLFTLFFDDDILFPVYFTTQAKAALVEILASDPVLHPLPLEAIAGLLVDVTTGVRRGV